MKRDEVDQKYNVLLLCLDKNDSTYEARKQRHRAKKEENDNSIDCLEARL